MLTEWLLQVYTYNDFLKSTKHRRVCFVRKWKHLNRFCQPRIEIPWNCLSFSHTKQAHLFL